MHSGSVRLPPRPARAPELAVLALPPRAGMEHAGLDRLQPLRHQPKQPDARRAVALRPVAVELRLLRLGQHVEAEPEVLLVSEAIHRRGVAIDGELQRDFDLEVVVLPGGRLEVRDHDAAVAILFDQVERADQRAVEDLAGTLYDNAKVGASVVRLSRARARRRAKA